MSALRFRSKSYIKFIKRHRCVGEHLHPEKGTKGWWYAFEIIDPEHRISQKWNKGSDGEAYPCCRICHDLVHKRSKKDKVHFWDQRGVSLINEIVTLHNEFLRENELTMLPDETFEECLERNGLGKHARSKGPKVVERKSRFLTFKRFKPIGQR